MRHPFTGGHLCPHRHRPFHSLVGVGRSQSLHFRGFLSLLHFIVAFKLDISPCVFHNLTKHSQFRTNFMAYLVPFNE